jgi:hypothetical protein
MEKGSKGQWKVDAVETRKRKKRKRGQKEDLTQVPPIFRVEGINKRYCGSIYPDF